MQSSKITVVVWFLVVTSTICLYKYISAETVSQEVRDAQKTVVLKRIAVERENIRRNDALIFYGEIASLFVLLSCALMVSWAYKGRLEVFVMELRNAKIPIRKKDLSKAVQIANDFSIAEKLEATFPEKAFALYEKMAEIRLKELNALMAPRRATIQAALLEATGEVLDLAPRPVPTFAELYARGELQEGKDLICGFNPQGEPQRRSLIDLKAVAVTGWQGSGKTLSMAYLTACTLIQCPGSRAIIIDPHSNHDEGLGSILRPLEGIGRAEIIRGASISAAITRLDKILDDRLEGRESSKNRIILVIDEMARLSKLPCFDTLMAFIERCTNEIRKANILFIGGSTKWTARHFKNRADIRGVMPSSLVHATKISQAELIIEDMGKEEKALLKQVEKPGTALLQTSSQRDPSLVRMPLITPADILHVAENLREANGGNLSSEQILHVDDSHKKQTLHVVSQPVSLPVSDQVSESETPTCLTLETPLKTQETPSRTLVLGYMQKNRKNTKEMANLLGVSVSMVKEVLAGRKKLTTSRKSKLLEGEK